MKFVDVLLAISVAVIWGGGFLFAKVAMEHFPPILLMAFRFAVTALTIVWFVPRPHKSMLWKICWVSVISATIQYSLTFSGLKGLDASTAIIVVHLEVPFGVLLAIIFLKERLTAIHIAGLLLAFGGVVLLAGEPRLQDNLFYVLLVAGGAMTWSVGQVMIKTLGSISSFTLIAWVAVFATPQLFLSSWIFESGQLNAIENATTVVWSAVVYLGLVMTALGYTIWYYLLGKYPVNRVMPFLLLLPIVPIAGGVLLLGETLTTQLITAGCMVVGGVAIINMAKPAA